MRIFKTLGAVLLVCAAYGLLGGRNPCFACIGAVFGLGSFWREGVRHGGNRFLGTLLGGLVVIPFYWLYANRPFGLPGHLYLVLGLFCVIYINLLFGAQDVYKRQGSRPTPQGPRGRTRHRNTDCAGNAQGARCSRCLLYTSTGWNRTPGIFRWWARSMS